MAQTNTTAPSPAPQASAAPPKPVYAENVRAATWMYFVLSTPLGVVLGLMTGAAIAGLVEGGAAVAFYLVLAVVAFVLVLALVTFTSMSVSVGDSAVDFAFGLFRKRLRFDDVSSVAPADYRWVEYGGWGIRIALGGKRAWSVPGVKRGVVIAVNEGGRRRTYFVSSARPESFAQSVQDALSKRTGRPVATTTLNE